jgi:hypothetical protein
MRQTRRFVRKLMRGWSASASDTVGTETPAFSAMSLRRGPERVRFLMAINRSKNHQSACI